MYRGGGCQVGGVENQLLKMDANGLGGALNAHRRNPKP